MLYGRQRQTGTWVRPVPSGAAWLCALAVLVVSGLCDGVLSLLGLNRTACILWAGATVALSAVNLPLGRSAVLVNPAGTLVPFCFALFLLTCHPVRSWALARVVTGSVAVGIVLCVIPAWAAEAGIGWTASLLAAVCAAVVPAIRVTWMSAPVGAVPPHV